MDPHELQDQSKEFSSENPRQDDWPHRVAYFAEEYLIYVFLGYLFWNSIPLFLDLSKAIYWRGWAGTESVLLCRWAIIGLHNIANSMCVYCSYVRKSRLPIKVKWLYVLLPTVSLSWQVLFGTWLRSLPIASAIRPQGLVPSLVIQMIGVSLLIAALYELKYCFAVTVEVRGHVQTGIYRYLRHPIYASYVLQNLSTLCLRPTGSVLMWSVVSIGLLAWRARLEEGALSAALPSYAEYRNSTPSMV